MKSLSLFPVMLINSNEKLLSLQCRQGTFSLLEGISTRRLFTGDELLNYKGILWRAFFLRTIFKVSFYRRGGGAGEGIYITIFTCYTWGLFALATIFQSLYTEEGDVPGTPP